MINYSEKKDKLWYQHLNSASFWKKPILLVINRAYLVSQENYKRIKINLDLIVHDECHSIKNKTTQNFYNYILENQTECKKVSCIGFSATPDLNIYPFNKIISNYTIYDAFCDDVIVPPHIHWLKSNKKLNDNDIIECIKKMIENLYYKKIIVWCGLIDSCYKTAELWKKKFPDYLIALDTSKNENSEFSSFKEYSECDKNAILFCACKHREGSDIKNLDCCIFLDKVEDRNSKTFVQCIGRVLRKDYSGHKRYGLIIDLKAISCLKICDRMNSFLNCKHNFPWDYSYSNEKINNKNVLFNKLELKKVDDLQKKKEIEYDISDVIDRFIKESPNEKIYYKRLKKELSIIEEKKLSSYLIRATEILKLTDYIPHVTRGSCGSSLVCFLLGISNVDPIKNNIKFERFLNEFRNNLPDIDFDFPHYLRDEVFLKLELKWPNQVARISNHVHWHDKSSLREAIRRNGINKQILKEDINSYLKSLPKDTQDNIKKIQKELNDTFRYYSLHCGGIVFFHDGIPEDILLKKENKTLSQIVYDKNDISKYKNFKIDILSSRGISQLIGVKGKNIDFNDCPFDEKTYNLLQSGDNIGITLAESPLMRKALTKIKPKSIDDIAICLAIIRPAAKDARMKDNDIDYNTEFVFDDDAIDILSKTLHISNDLADKFRRCLSKNKWDEESKKKFEFHLTKVSKFKKNEMMKKLSNLRKYSFCRSHSYSYAQLVYKLAYEKAHNNKKFWESTIKNVKSSYRKWVHLYEARLAGVKVANFIDKTNDISIYAENRRKKFNGLDKEEQLRKFGYWDMTTKEFFNDCYFYKKNEEYYFGGLIASSRVLSSDNIKKIVLSICVEPKKYIEIIAYNNYFNSKHIKVKGRAKLISESENVYESNISKFN